MDANADRSQSAEWVYAQAPRTSLALGEAGCSATQGRSCATAFDFWILREVSVLAIDLCYLRTFVRA
jgi:hypothetical protein